MKKSNGVRKGGTGRWPWMLAAVLFAVWTFAPVAANAQRLWSVGEVSRAPDGLAVVMEGVAVIPGLDGPGGAAAPRVSAEVQVTYDYLRLGFGFLELPLPDGSVIEAENAVFEDRGDGNLMWTGEVPGAGYESVVFTVRDGHLMGWFGQPGGSNYVVYAGPDGKGTVSVDDGPTGDWCGVGTERGGELDLGREVARAVDRPVTGISESRHDRLDILVPYDEGAAGYWSRAGGIELAIQASFDVMNMALRTGGISVRARPLPVLVRPTLGSAPLERHRNPAWPQLGATELMYEPEVDRLRLSQRADLVSVVAYPPYEYDYAGIADPIGWLLIDDLARYGFGNTVQAPYLGPSRLLAHEVGHNLGSGHEAPYDPCCGTAGQTSVCGMTLPPDACGHTDLAATPNPVATIMSYGRVPAGSKGARGLPYYSSPDRNHTPNDGWTLGIAGEADNVRVFRDVTLPRAVKVSNIALPRSSGLVDLKVEWTGRDSAKITWRPSVDYPSVLVRLEDGFWDFVYSSDSIELFDSWVLDEDDRKKGVNLAGLRPGGRYSFAVTHSRGVLSGVMVERPPSVSGAPNAASSVAARVTGTDRVRLSWTDKSGNEDGFEVWYREWSGEDQRWQRYGQRLPAGTRFADVVGLAAEEEIQVTDGYYNEENVWIQGSTAMRGRYSFVVVAYNDKGSSASETFDLEFMPGPWPEGTASGEVTNCMVGRSSGLGLDGYEVDVCLETPDGARRRAWDYGLGADQSGLLYFFDRDNVEILVKVLDGCAVNGHRWVFIAPVTDLPFRLSIREVGPYLKNRRQVWMYDSKRRSQDRIAHRTVGNPRGQTARTVSDTTAFPCTTAEVAAATSTAATVGDGASGVASGRGPLGTWTAPASASRLVAGAATDCTPSGPSLTLDGGYTVSMCYETSAGAVGQARDWGLDSSQSALLYFFDRNNVEVLIKVLDGCGVNGHRWVFVAPVTDLAFNLHVESPAGERWIHRNRLGQTADAAGDTSAFPCGASA